MPENSEFRPYTEDPEIVAEVYALQKEQKEREKSSQQIETINKKVEESGEKHE